MQSPFEAHRQAIKGCPRGPAGWKTFEDVCLDALTFLLVPPLSVPHVQPRSYSGIDRRDAVFPNRNRNEANNWGLLLHELEARLVLFEFKNYDATDVGKDEVNQTRNYLTRPMGRLAIMVTTREPNEAAHIKRNSIYSDEGKVILFLTTSHLEEMLYMKERGEDPSDLVLDLVEQFYIQHE
jgi:hypothetical protein